MIKRMIILIIMGLTLSSCDFIHYGKIAIQDNMYRVERARERKELSKKDGPGAIMVDEYKKDVERVLNDIKKRPVNKRVEFEGATFIIPENTRLNPKHGNIVDEKTGYGIPILFKTDDGCTPETFYTKKVRSNLYIVLGYNYKDKGLDAIGQKIIKANAFSKNCKQ